MKQHSWLVQDCYSILTHSQSDLQDDSLHIRERILFSATSIASATFSRIPRGRFRSSSREKLIPRTHLANKFSRPSITSHEIHSSRDALRSSRITTCTSVTCSCRVSISG